PEQVLRTFCRRALRPAVLEGAAGGVDSECDVLPSGLRDLGKRLLARGIDRRVVLAGTRLDELAVHEVAVALFQRDDLARLGCGRVLPAGRDRRAVASSVELAHRARRAGRVPPPTPHPGGEDGSAPAVPQGCRACAEFGTISV